MQENSVDDDDDDDVEVYIRKRVVFGPQRKEYILEREREGLEGGWGDKVRCVFGVVWNHVRVVVWGWWLAGVDDRDNEDDVWWGGVGGWANSGWVRSAIMMALAGSFVVG